MDKERGKYFVHFWTAVFLSYLILCLITGRSL